MGLVLIDVVIRQISLIRGYLDDLRLGYLFNGCVIHFNSFWDWVMHRDCVFYLESDYATSLDVVALTRIDICHLLTRLCIILSLIKLERARESEVPTRHPLVTKFIEWLYVYTLLHK